MTPFKAWREPHRALAIKEYSSFWSKLLFYKNGWVVTRLSLRNSLKLNTSKRVCACVKCSLYQQNGITQGQLKSKAT